MSGDTTAMGGKLVVWQAPVGTIQVNVRAVEDTILLSLAEKAELFSRDKSVVSRHLRNVFSSGELEREAVVVKNATTAADGKTYQVEFFSLAMVALALLVAASEPAQKALMIRLVLNLLGDEPS